jgi:hypothetical protein
LHISWERLLAAPKAESLREGERESESERKGEREKERERGEHAVIFRKVISHNPNP